MQSRKTVILFLVLLVIALVGLGAAFMACSGPLRQLHGSVPISAGTSTLLLTGPARGHWAEESEHPVMVYTVPGTDCSWTAQAGPVQIESRGKISLGESESLCVLPLRDGQRVLFHAVRP